MKTKFKVRHMWLFGLLFFGLAVSAWSQQVTLKLKDVKFEKVLSEIKAQTDCSFVFSDQLVDVNRRISIDVREMPLAEALTQLLNGTNLSFEIRNKQIFFIEKRSPSFSGNTGPKSKRLVKGTVTDLDGNPIAGANIIEAGTNNGLITDMEGRFSLEVDENGTIQISYISYETQELAVKGKSSLVIKLKEETKNLDEVVVVGYGKSNRKDVTGAVSSMKSEDMNMGVVVSPAQMLQGKVPGLNITKSGNPNDKGTIVLRGSSSLRNGANEPFYVIDGVPGASIELVSPDDIVNIDVLKDASSNAIYGSRAANGVIMITTRRAKDQERMYASYHGYVGIESVSKRLNMMSGDQLRDYTQGTLNPVYDDIDGANTNWQEEIQRTALSTNHGVSFGGSGKTMVYGASINYANNQGIIRGSDFTRLIFRANIEQRIFNDRLTLGLNLSTSKRTSNNIHPDVLLNMLQFLPTVPVMKDGKYSENLTRTGFYGNPVAMIENNKLRDVQSVTLVNMNAKLKIIEGMTLNLNYSKQSNDSKGYSYYGSTSTIESVRGMGGLAIRSNYVNYDDIFEGYLDYGKIVGEHDLKAMIGYSWQQNRMNDGFQNANAGFVTDDLLYNNLGLGNTPDKVSSGDRWGTSTVSTLRMISFYGRLNYQFGNRYLAQVTVRRDGSSAFGVSNQWGTFPAASVGWKIHNEPFMKNIKSLSELRLRASYGISGNSSGFDPMIARMKYGKQGTTVVAGQITNAIGPTQNANPDLKWETTGMFNVGLDFGFFDGRLTGVLEYYNKTTKDLIWDYAVPTTEYLVGSLLANVGKIRNSGFEMQLNGRIIQTKQFSWSSSIVVSTNKNEVVSLTNDKFTDTFRRVAYIGGPGQSNLTGQIVEEGKSLGTWFMPAWAGRDDNNVSVYYDKEGNIVTDASSSNYREFTKGTALPTVLYGWQNTLKYRNFDLAFFFRGVAGNYIMNCTRAQFNRIGESNQFNILVEAGNEPREDARNHFRSDRYLENGSYIRLDNATVGYTFKTNIPGLSSLRLYCTGNNLFVITKYKGIDPEVNLSGLDPGIDNKGYYPKTRSFIVGLLVNF